MKFFIRDAKLARRHLSVEINVDHEADSFVQLLDDKQHSAGSSLAFPDNSRLRSLAEQAWQGIKKGYAPVLCEEGVGGTYFFRNSDNRNVAVFKPNDEEPYNVNNPKGYTPPSSPTLGSFVSPGSFAASPALSSLVSPSLLPHVGYKQGILAGEASIRECAAYLLDHEHFANVPQTDLAVAQHPIFFTNQNGERPRSASLIVATATPPMSGERPRAQTVTPGFLGTSLKGGTSHSQPMNIAGVATGTATSSNSHGSHSHSHNQSNSHTQVNSSLSHSHSHSYSNRSHAFPPAHFKALHIQAPNDAATSSQFQDELKLKFGSFQEFREHDGDTEDLGLNIISKFPVQEVHKIAILDIRLLNTDRHGGNILFKHITENGTRSITLIPIDHGYTLPSTFADLCFIWLTFPQSKLKMSPHTRSYIESLDVERDISLLQKKFGKKAFNHEHFRNMRIAMLWLKKTTKADLTPYQIGHAMCRPDIDCSQSALERMCQDAALRVVGTSPSNSPATPTRRNSKGGSRSGFEERLDIQEFVFPGDAEADVDEADDDDDAMDLATSSSGKLTPGKSETEDLEDAGDDEGPQDVMVLLNKIPLQQEQFLMDELALRMDQEISSMLPKDAVNA